MEIDTELFTFLLKTDPYGQIKGTYNHQTRSWKGDLDFWKVTAATIAGLILVYGLIVFPALAAYGGVSYKLVSITALLNIGLAKYLFPEKCFQIGELPSEYLSNLQDRFNSLEVNEIEFAEPQVG